LTRMLVLGLHELAQALKKLAKELGETPTRDEFMASGASDYSIRMAGNYTKILAAAGLESRAQALKDYTPKVLVFDIETSPIIAHVWSLWDQNVGLNQIMTEWHIMSWSAKWL